MATTATYPMQIQYLNLPCNCENFLKDFYYKKTGSSGYFSNFKTTYVDFNFETIMFGIDKNSNITFKKGLVKADYIFINKECGFNPGKAKFSGEVYLIDNEDFNNIYKTWTNSGMLKYMQKHHLKGIHYEEEPYDSHYKELIELNTEADYLS
ncbi:MAG: hypothetical protein J0H68_08830 [Sphingobacteriia bacterium]|nr:hypothetical protein [Sphingobacteriia bacterium]